MIWLRYINLTIPHTGTMTSTTRYEYGNYQSDTNSGPWTHITRQHNRCIACRIGMMQLSALTKHRNQN